jgi:hypothetical protein
MPLMIRAPLAAECQGLRVEGAEANLGEEGTARDKLIVDRVQRRRARRVVDEVVQDAEAADQGCGTRQHELLGAAGEHGHALQERGALEQLGEQDAPHRGRGLDAGDAQALRREGKGEAARARPEVDERPIRPG